ncbi:3-hydroxyacyl-ACP dehydratase FabZ [Devosia sp. 63-57]|uniref:3-hydroxyacyl-ACP dehydratase FabZ n=1 Tax=Devosia sp. 63-57 TaxID=1895751 RepID=UPI00086BA851|nr:3-hydroxyacyl-ACP dehydratase FabZ [Devosia sp. 63-57]ODT50213.1 MAG: 3-hydroxyacyl-[acyl-carrier-protein] dehydratase FabZ [Pelagibacterium sp. SCN 63-126]ODU84641.1 MAG: 3-hydroxyacyl-[acyl-carrier-protein] dehydratase FabZ [Pelagibacterium sp. SCN 63-17]OJX44957.1 MAG: 3-hydroxyacyl-[acyl-carrier-protein] dehydratase FabZ [Devosia sp. 63-57]
MNDTVTEATELDAMSIAEILEALPHRYPFLMIDKIIDINGDESAVGIKNITFNEPIFQGHFPGNPIFPGVLIIEGMAQTAGAIVIKHDGNANGKKIVMMLGVDNARFRKPAGPGDRLEFHISKMHRRRNVGRYEAKAIVDGKVVAEAEITAMIVGADS